MPTRCTQDTDYHFWEQWFGALAHWRRNKLNFNIFRLPANKIVPLSKPVSLSAVGHLAHKCVPRYMASEPSASLKRKHGDNLYDSPRYATNSKGTDEGSTSRDKEAHITLVLPIQVENVAVAAMTASRAALVKGPATSLHLALLLADTENQFRPREHPKKIVGGHCFEVVYTTWLISFPLIVIVFFASFYAK